MSPKAQELPSLLLMDAMISSVKLQGGKEVVVRIVFVVPAGEAYEAVAGLLAQMVMGDAIADVQVNVKAMQSKMAPQA